MLRRSVVVERDAQLEHCIVMERSRISQGARIRRAIIDQDNDIPPNEEIGIHPEADRQRFAVTDSGIVVVPRMFFPARAQRPALSISPAAGAQVRPSDRVLTDSVFRVAA